MGTYLNIGGIHLLNGKTDQAMENFNIGLRLNPYSPRLHNNMGRALMAQKRYHEAAASFEKALTLKPDDPIATANLEKLAVHLK